MAGRGGPARPYMLQTNGPYNWDRSPHPPPSGALFAALFCVTLRLIRIEEKLNTLASKTEKPESDRASNHIEE